jgi:hypothetical protein
MADVQRRNNSAAQYIFDSVVWMFAVLAECRGAQTKYRSPDQAYATHYHQFRFDCSGHLLEAMPSATLAAM